MGGMNQGWAFWSSKRRVRLRVVHLGSVIGVRVKVRVRVRVKVRVGFRVRVRLRVVH